MFTGIIETVGTVQSLKKKSRDSDLLAIKTSRPLKAFKIGASLAVNGTCLTLIKSSKKTYFFNVVRETKKRTTLGMLAAGKKVNLERPLKWNGRVEGHFVLGHIDGVGTVKKVAKKGAEKSFLIGSPPALKKYILEKGSVSVDGVSLTVGKLTQQGFWIHCIPHTLKCSTLGILEEGNRVNLETDILIKNVFSRRSLN